MGDRYREKVSRLRDALNEPSHRTEAAEILRSLIDKITLTLCIQDGRKTHTIDIAGHLAGICGSPVQASAERRGMVPIRPVRISK